MDTIASLTVILANTKIYFSTIQKDRRIYDNLRKVLAFLPVANGTQSLVMVVAILAG